LLNINSAVKTNSWLSSWSPNSKARLRLFCSPYAGGSSLVFRDWHKTLPRAVEVCPIQLPGRGSRLREASFTQLSALVVALAEALQPQLEMPFAFFGHSMGAIINFELARLLRKEYGLTPLHLFVSGRRAPQVPRREPVTHNLPEPEFLRELSRLKGTPTEILTNFELMQLMLPVLRADFALCETYTYVAEAPLTCPISAFGGLQDRRVTSQDLEDWRKQTNSFYRLRMLPGDHFFLNTAQPLLLELLTRELVELVKLL